MEFIQWNMIQLSKWRLFNNPTLIRDGLGGGAHCTGSQHQLSKLFSQETDQLTKRWSNDSKSKIPTERSSCGFRHSSIIWFNKLIILCSLTIGSIDWKTYGNTLYSKAKLVVSLHEKAVSSSNKSLFSVSIWLRPHSPKCSPNRLNRGFQRSPIAPSNVKDFS